MLSRFSDNRHQTETNTDRLNPTLPLDGGSKTDVSSSVSWNKNSIEHLSNAHNIDTLSRENIAADAVLDRQEAASLLARLGNSGMSS